MQRLFTRTAVLVCFARVAADIGLNVKAMSAEVGIAKEPWTTPDLRVRAGRVHRLLELAAARADVVDVGIRVARERLSLAHLDALGTLARDEPDVRSVLLRLARDTHLHSNSNTLRLSENEEVAVLDPELRGNMRPTTCSWSDRAVRMVFDAKDRYPSQWAAIESIAGKIGCTGETLRKWVCQGERDSGVGQARTLSSSSASRTSSAMFANCARPTRSRSWPARISPRQSSTVNSRSERLH